MEPRIEAELELIRTAYPAVVYQDDWLLIPDYPMPPDWSAAVVDVVSYLRPGYGQELRSERGAARPLRWTSVIFSSAHSRNRTTTPPRIQ